MVSLHADSYRRHWMNNNFNTFFTTVEGDQKESLGEFFLSSALTRIYLSLLVYLFLRHVKVRWITLDYFLWQGLELTVFRQLTSVILTRINSVCSIIFQLLLRKILHNLNKRGRDCNSREEHNNYGAFYAMLRIWLVHFNLSISQMSQAALCPTKIHREVQSPRI